ncbi:hypothetical protein PHLGIDRAFT_117597 [Phlebiopsis gigantea 11061_1 CR5-6]|uniref:LYC1 C-terminal domain-containing protein n=1 Tax=Phlebiopsis gigantea (strain 11061_1 CR5-6) TaxID=745531 RepID=A0A0C3PMW4_PHLG1|nr:hypothetical protein PHLGIDRAFT_117597 [Phlebiopsis gigantea 11061_1 CR5-6]
MKADARALAKGDDVVLAFLPDEGVGLFTIQWQMAFTAKMEPVYPLATWGVELVGDGEEAPTYATWILGRESPPSLFLTRLRATPETFPKLLRKIMEAARIQGVAAVDTWNIPDQFKEAALELGGETYERETQLPVAKWYGPEPSENIVWAFNERFSWI